MALLARGLYLGLVALFALASFARAHVSDGALFVSDEIQAPFDLVIPLHTADAGGRRNHDGSGEGSGGSGDESGSGEDHEDSGQGPLSTSLTGNSKNNNVISYSSFSDIPATATEAPYMFSSTRPTSKYAPDDHQESGSGEDGSGSGNDDLGAHESTYEPSEAVTTAPPETTDGVGSSDSDNSAPRLFRYVGCYADDSNVRSMDVLVARSSAMTPSLCALECRQAGSYTFFGLEYSEECWCGNNPFKHGPQNGCDYPCLGDNTIACGGYMVQSIYVFSGHRFSLPTTETPTPAPMQKYEGLDYKGCYADSDTTRALSGAHFVVKGMDAPMCQRLCLAAGDYKYIGLQYSYECFCGNTPFTYGAARPSMCSAACGGNPSVACGGYLFSSIYHITGVPSTVPVVAEVDGAVYQGCYRDGDPDDLSFGPFISNSMTPALCRDLCSDYKFFGVQAGSHCACGQMPFLYGASTGCTSTCEGDASIVCGGTDANSIYAVCDGLGCGFDSAIEPAHEALVSASGTNGGGASTPSSGSAVPAWVVGVIVGCVAVVAAALVVVVSHRRLSSREHTIPGESFASDYHSIASNPLFAEDARSVALSREQQADDARSRVSSSESESNSSNSSGDAGVEKYDHYDGGSSEARGSYCSQGDDAE